MPIKNTNFTKLAQILLMPADFSRFNYDFRTNSPFCRWIWLKQHYFLLYDEICVTTRFFCSISVNSALFHSFFGLNDEFFFTTLFPLPQWFFCNFPFFPHVHFEFGLSSLFYHGIWCLCSFFCSRHVWPWHNLNSMNLVVCAAQYSRKNRGKSSPSALFLRIFRWFLL